MEDPILFLCSDDLDRVLPAFEKFYPVIARDLQVKLPETIQDKNIEFYIDFFILSKCDIVPRAIVFSVLQLVYCMNMVECLCVHTGTFPQGLLFSIRGTANHCYG